MRAEADGFTVDRRHVLREGGRTRWLSGRYYVFTLGRPSTSLALLSTRYMFIVRPILLQTSDRCVSCNWMISKPDKPANGSLTGSLAYSLTHIAVIYMYTTTYASLYCCTWCKSTVTALVASDLPTTRVTTQDRLTQPRRAYSTVNLTELYALSNITYDTMRLVNGSDRKS